MDFLRRLSDIGDYAIEQGVDVFVFAGDAYKTRDPNPTHQREFARRIKKIADAGIPVIMLVGNHDLPAVAKRATSIDIFGTLDVPNVTVGNREEVIRITCRRGQPLQVATAPYPLRTALLSKEQQQGKSLNELDGLLQAAMIANITALASQVHQQPDIPAILVGHFSVNEASHGSEQNIMIGRDAAHPPLRAGRPGLPLCRAGPHPQAPEPQRRPPAAGALSGSIERIDFGEEHEPKGFVVAEIGDGPTTWEFVRGYRRQARPFVTVRVDVRDRPDPTAAVVEAIKAKPESSTGSGRISAVVRVVVTLRQEQEALLVEREISGRWRARTSWPRCKRTSSGPSASAWARSPWSR